MDDKRPTPEECDEKITMLEFEINAVIEEQQDNFRIMQARDRQLSERYWEIVAEIAKYRKIKESYK